MSCSACSASFPVDCRLLQYWCLLLCSDFRFLKMQGGQGSSAIRKIELFVMQSISVDMKRMRPAAKKPILQLSIGSSNALDQAVSRHVVSISKRQLSPSKSSHFATEEEEEGLRVAQCRYLRDPVTYSCRDAREVPQRDTCNRRRYDSFVQPAGSGSGSLRNISRPLYLLFRHKAKGPTHFQSYPTEELFA